MEVAIVITVKKLLETGIVIKHSGNSDIYPTFI